jgi:hypothetical protein
MSDAPPKPPEILDKIVDKVLAHHPKAKTKSARKRQRLRRLLLKEGK